MSAAWQTVLQRFDRSVKLSPSATQRVKRGFCAVIDCGNVSAVGSKYCHPTRCDDFFETLTADELEAWAL